MNQKYLKRVQFHDRIARRVITVGGMAVIFSVILILFLIARVAFPLFHDPTATPVGQFALDDPTEALAIGIDEYLENAFVLGRDGSIEFFHPLGGNPIERVELEAPAAGARVEAIEKIDPQNYHLLWSDGSSTVEGVSFAASFGDKGLRSFSRQVSRQALWPPHQGPKPNRVLVRQSDEENRVRVSLLEGQRLQVEQKSVSEDLFGQVQEADHVFLLEDVPPQEKITSLTMDDLGRTLYAGTDQGSLLRWDLSEPGEPALLDRLPAFTDRRAITALTMIYGDISLAVGDAKGNVTTWFPVASPATGGVKRLELIHTLTRHNSPIRGLIASPRDKSLLSINAEGIVHFDHMTSERHLLSLAHEAPIQLLSISGRGDVFFALDANGRANAWKVENNHPEVSWRTLFGKVWYENYNEPVYAWQSSSASDDFEPKLSLTPLIFGTIKGTCYAMLFALPLALFGAIYTSQFGHESLRGVIKPAVEIMAAVPSVIIGFLAALWFAPLLEKSVTALFLSILFIPTFLLLSLVLWQLVRKRLFFKRMARGYEFLLLMPVLTGAVALAWHLGPAVETWLFGGDFTIWLFGEVGTRYDPRNNIVIAFALGFAVIPIIFTIAEDALSNVPHSLKAASLALGASRWQTVWRVILPSASPGIFAGTMIGFGRAIGETMIVLMATGNTAIMDWSIFNGMRPLSSNIAVEIPEAPFGSSLYRVLFLSAVLLFAMTFILNTVAELIRQRLRKKYGRF